MNLVEKFAACLNLYYSHVENDGSYYIARRLDKLYIFFECSNGETDWKSNFDFPVRPYRDMRDKWYCHRGFLKVWKSIEPYICDDILDLEIKEIEIVGYSHGGAIAQLCYEYVKFHRPDVLVTGFGFGSPRVFWGHASKAVRERFNGFVVVRNGCDIVTHLPPALFGFRYICEVLKIGSHVGLIRDHYPEQYTEALFEYETEKELEKYNDKSML